LRELTRELAKRRHVGLSTSESRHPIKVHDGAYALELEAHFCTLDPNSGTADSQCRVLPSFQITMHIYIYLVLRTTAIQCGYFDTQARRLKLALEMLEPEVFRVQYPSDLLFWTLFIGGVAAKSDKAWFKAEAVKSCTILGVTCWEEARAFLKTFPWFEQYCNPLFNAFWEDLYFGQQSAASVK
jgi:hypothetical protein